MMYLMLIDTQEEKRDFVRIYDKYKYLMLKIATEVLEDQFMAEDAVHDAFVKLAGSMDMIHEVESLATKRYLITITKNAAIDIYRKRKKVMQKEMYVDELGENVGGVTYMESDLDNEVLDVLLNLPLKYRDVFILKYSSHMSNYDIARTLDISEGTVRQRIARGKELIKAQLEGGK